MSAVSQAPAAALASAGGARLCVGGCRRAAYRCASIPPRAVLHPASVEGSGVGVHKLRATKWTAVVSGSVSLWSRARAAGCQVTKQPDSIICRSRHRHVQFLTNSRCKRKKPRLLKLSEVCAGKPARAHLQIINKYSTFSLWLLVVGLLQLPHGTNPRSTTM